MNLFLLFALVEFFLLTFVAQQAIPVVVQQSREQIWLLASTPIIVALGVGLQTWLVALIAKRQEKKTDIVAERVSEATHAAADHAAKAESSAAKAEESAGKTLVLIDKTHTLVNSQYGIALQLIVNKAKYILEQATLIAHIKGTAENRRKLLAAQAELNDAEQKLAEHEAKQTVVDAKEGVAQ
jgi:hypothetical protein